MIILEQTVYLMKNMVFEYIDLESYYNIETTQNKSSTAVYKKPQ